MDKEIDPVNPKCLRDRENKTKRLFQLRREVPVQVLHEAICLRLEMLSAVVEVMSRVEFVSSDGRLLQRYGWALDEIVGDLKELCYCAWEKSY